MSLDKIVSISGKPGLYKLITQTRAGFVAESLLDNKRISVNIQTNVSVLSEIAMYTMTEEVPLKQVFSNIRSKENGEQTSVQTSDANALLVDYLSEVLPDYDQDRVYTSDIKKVIKWYNILQKNNLLNLLDTESENNKPQKA